MTGVSERPQCSEPRPSGGERGTSRRSPSGPAKGQERTIATLARSGDRGYVTLFVAGVSLGVISVVGLVLDGGRALRAQSDSFGAAAAAARAGAQELDPVASVAGELRLDGDAAGEAAHRFLADRGLSGTVTVTDVQVTVTVTRDVDFAVLPGSARLDATATSRVTRERAPS